MCTPFFVSKHSTTAAACGQSVQIAAFNVDVADTEDNYKYQVVMAVACVRRDITSAEHDCQ